MLSKDLLDNNISTKAKGDLLEDLMIELCEKYNIKYKKTRMSGALHGDGDIVIQDDITLDGKVHGQCKNVNVSKTELDKISSQASILGNKGAIVTPIIYDDDRVIPYIVLKLTDLFDILKNHDKIHNK